MNARPLLQLLGILVGLTRAALAEEPTGFGEEGTPPADVAPEAEEADGDVVAQPDVSAAAPPSADAATPPRNRDGGLADACTEAMTWAGLRRGGVGVRLVRVSDGAVPCEVAGEVPRLPASTTKVVTAAVALERLGPDFRFTTELVAAPGGVRRGDRWEGDLWVVPSGDPTLDTARWRSLVDGLRRQGISEVDGRVVLAAGLHADPPWIPRWPLDDFRQNASYYATLGPFATDGLRVTALLRPGAVAGDPAIVELSPPQEGFIQVQNRATTSSSAWTRRGTVRRSVSSTGWQLEVSGAIGLEARPQTLGSWMVDQPDASAAALLRALLSEAGIGVREVVVSAERPPVGLALSTVASEPLWTVLQPMNKRSSNFLAEMVFRAIGVHANPVGWGATAEDASRAVAAHFARLGLDPSEAWLVNGSGLTREHKLSPRALTTVLLDAVRDPRFGEELVASLSVAGRDGTLSRRMTGTEPGQVRGKTGTLNGVVGLCGTFVGKDGEVYVFAMLSNDGPSAGSVRASMDALVNRWIVATGLPVEASSYGPDAFGGTPADPP